MFIILLQPYNKRFPPCRKLKLKELRWLAEDHKFRSSKSRTYIEFSFTYITIIPAIPQGNGILPVLKESVKICGYNSL